MSDTKKETKGFKADDFWVSAVGGQWKSFQKSMGGGSKRRKTKKRRKNMRSKSRSFSQRHFR